MTINDSFSDLLLENVLQKPVVKQDFITVEESDIFRMVNNVTICTVIGLFGIVANVINMIVFYRQGFNTTTNISFFALAISDIGCLVTVEWYNIALNPYLEKADINFLPEDIVYLSGDWLHISFGRVTSWITVFVTAERFLGITLPLKVKQIITLRRTSFTMGFLFFINFAILLPEHAITYLDWKFVPSRNRTLYGLMYRSFSGQLYGLVYTLASVSGFMSFIFVILLSVMLVTKLQQKSKWRKLATSGNESSDAVSSRDKKTVKMIIMIAVILIVCYTPGAALSLVPNFEPEFMIGKAMNTSCHALWSITFVFSTVNSSANIFLYYTMSTKYRLTFNELLGWDRKGQESNSQAYKAHKDKSGT